MIATPFTLDVSDAAVVDLKHRLALARWPDEVEGSAWEYGTPMGLLKGVVECWRETFDWRRAERRLNSFPQFQMEVDGQIIHFLHIKGVGDSAPLVLTHGWPGSFVEMYKLIPMLMDPPRNGFPNFASFDVVVPSLPGFGFSQSPTRGGVSSRSIASTWHGLMRGLGYTRYFAQGGDIGAGVSSWMARMYPDAMRALHLNFIPSSYQPHLGGGERPLSVGESAWLTERAQWIEREGGYSHIQATKPQTLAYSLVDSPVGLAAWILEKFHSWSDGDGELSEKLDLDELLTNLSVYWFSGNVGATLRIYKENAREPFRFDEGERVIPPLCYARFPREILSPPREWIERAYNLIRWTDMPRGGHFAALEQPGLLARDIHESFAPFRKAA
jgi:pimeloyl-ACP methyl ester carboxylesterase